MLVLDSSFVVAALVEEEYTGYADSVIRDHMEEGLAAPSLVRWEFANVLNVKLRRGGLRRDQAMELLVLYEGLGIVHLEPEAALDRLLAVAASSGLTAYDAAYVELAARLSAPLATLDAAMARAAQAAGLTVHSPFAS